MIMAQTHSKSALWIKRLQEEGYRLTNPRRIVVDILAHSKQAMDANEIYREAKKQHARIGLVSVYRTIEKLEDLKLIQRVHKPEGCHAYIAGFVGHQHLLICSQCGRAEFFEGEDLQPLLDRVSEESHYLIQDHWLQLFGICPDCRKANKT